MNLIPGASLLVLALMLPAGPATAQVDPGAATPNSTAPWVRRPPQVFGYLQFHYRYAFDTGSDTLVDNDNFRVQRVRIGIKGDIYPWLSYDVEIDPRAPTIQTVLRDAFIEMQVIPRHVIRLGQQKTQFGYETRVSSSDLYTVNRAELSDALARGITLRDLGIGLIGSVKLGPRGLRLEDAITVVNGAGMNVQADDTPRKNVSGRLGLRWRKDASDLVARFGVSGSSGDLVDREDPVDPFDDFTLTFRRLGTDLQVDHRRFFLSAEYITGRHENSATSETETVSGYYLTLVGKTTRQVGPLLRYDVLVDEFERWTFGGYYGAPSAPFRVLVNYEYRPLKDGLPGDDKFYLWTQVRF